MLKGPRYGFMEPLYITGAMKARIMPYEPLGSILEGVRVKTVRSSCVPEIYNYRAEARKPADLPTSGRASSVLSMRMASA
jgi:hypothetical protein